MTGKFTVFFTFHTSSAPFIVFVDGNFKCITYIDTVNLTFLALTDCKILNEQLNCAEGIIFKIIVFLMV